ncbi:MAG: SDR family oxidoreductase [Rhizobiales bacterium]|nr:SDR family oxidoreductase [Hyphomicrobiales bacterium]
MTRSTRPVALVTGASRGIGRAIALRLARDGATVGVHYKSGEAEAAETVGAVAAAGGSAFAVQADLGSPDGPALLAQSFGRELTGRFGEPGFDILVNNAGIGRRARIADVSEADFDRILTVNLKAPFFLIRTLLPHLRDGGRIINLSSMGTRAAYPDMAVYAPAKAGLEALTRLLAAELGARGITVNAVLPGATATDMNPGARDPATSAQIARTVALGRVGQPEDIAGVVGFLASAAGGWVTGQSIDASGGQRL